MKIAYAGIDLMASALETLIGESNEILKVFTCPCDNKTEFNTEIIGIAEKNGIGYTLDRITGADLEEMGRLGCELFICAGYYYRIPVTDAFPMINFHPAPLPDCRGCWPMPQILMGAYGCGGITAHRIAFGFDEGDIVMQRNFDIPDGWTLTDYMEHVNKLVPDMVRELTGDLDCCLAHAHPQSEGRYLSMPAEKDYTVTADMTVEEADRIMRAFYGYEVFYIAGDGTKYELIRCRANTAGGGSLALKDGTIQSERLRIL